MLRRGDPFLSLEDLCVIGLGIESYDVCDFGDAVICRFNEIGGFLDSFIDEVVDWRDVIMLLEGMNQIILILIGFVGEMIKCDGRSIMYINIIFDVGAFLCRILLCRQNQVGFASTDYVQDKYIQEVLTDGIVVLFFLFHFIDKSMKNLKNFILAFPVVMDTVILRGMFIGVRAIQKQGETFDAQHNIFQGICIF